MEENSAYLQFTTSCAHLAGWPRHALTQLLSPMLYSITQPSPRSGPCPHWYQQSHPVADCPLTLMEGDGEPPRSLQFNSYSLQYDGNRSSNCMRDFDEKKPIGTRPNPSWGPGLNLPLGILDCSSTLWLSGSDAGNATEKCNKDFMWVSRAGDLPGTLPFSSAPGRWWRWRAAHIHFASSYPGRRYSSTGLTFPASSFPWLLSPGWCLPALLIAVN